LVVHCLFEQSGTFKNEFRKLGYDAYDYDILNDYGETDKQIDLFSEIRGGYEGKPSIFDSITQEDLILAFFPCTRFNAIIPLRFRGEQLQQRNDSDEKKLLTSMKLHDELHRNYETISMMALICLRRGLRLVIENPFTKPHYLTDFWCLKPAIIDRDRRNDGDSMKKPTQYWFIGFKPKNNLIMEPIDFVPNQTLTNINGERRYEKRSEIHPQYANRFIRKFLIDEKGGNHVIS